MFDLKVINSVLDQMEDERGIPREKMLDAIEQALATAYKKEFGKRGQIIRAEFDINTGTTTFNQIKVVVEENMLRPEEPETEDEGGAETEKPEKKHRKDNDEEEVPDAEGLIRFDPEKHILIENALLIKKDIEVGGELIFPLDAKDDFGRIAAQTAKQVIIQKIREAEKESALAEFGQKSGDVIMGHVQRFERGNLYVDLGRVTGVMPYDEQIPGERFKPGDRIRALLVTVDETSRGIFLKLSRSHPDFLKKLFEIEAPELQNETVVVKAIAREAGSRSKIAVMATDPHIDPVGSMVGQRGVRVSTVMSELGGEKIDIIEWSPEMVEFIEDSLSPAQVLNVSIASEPTEDDGTDDKRGHATVEVAPDQQSLAIGRGGQNVRLAAKLTGWKIDIQSAGEDESEDGEGSAPEEKKGAKSEEAPVDESPASETEEKEEVLEDDDTENVEGGTEAKEDTKEVSDESEESEVTDDAEEKKEEK